MAIQEEKARDINLARRTQVPHRDEHPRPCRAALYVLRIEPLAGLDLSASITDASAAKPLRAALAHQCMEMRGLAC